MLGFHDNDPPPEDGDKPIPSIKDTLKEKNTHGSFGDSLLFTLSLFIVVFCIVSLWGWLYAGLIVGLYLMRASAVAKRNNKKKVNDAGN